MPKRINEGLLNPIGHARMYAGFKRKGAAEKLNVTPQYLSQIESTKSQKKPSLGTIEEMCKLYKCTMDELIHGIHKTNRGRHNRSKKSV